MRAGKLRHRVAIQNFTNVKDAYGEEIQTWATASTVSASVEQLRANERQSNGTIATEATHKITMRYNTTVTQKSRIVHDGNDYEVTEITNPDSRKIMLEIICKAHSNG